MTPYRMQNLVYKWVNLKNFSLIWAKIGSNLRKFWEKSGNFTQNLVQIRPIGIWMGHLFLKHWYLYQSTVYFRNLGWHVPTKTKLEYPPPPDFHPSVVLEHLFLQNMVFSSNFQIKLVRSLSERVQADLKMAISIKLHIFDLHVLRQLS